MAKKPDAARGKTTRIGKIKKIIKRFKTKPKNVGMGMNMSPGAMGGRTKTKMPQRLTPAQRARLKGMRPMTKAAKSTIKGAGMTGAAMTGQAMKLAKRRGR